MFAIINNVRTKINEDVNVNEYGVKFRTSLRFWESKGWIDKTDPYGWFQ